MGGALSSLLALLACADPTAEDSAPPTLCELAQEEAPSLEVGTGTVLFEPLDDGGSIEVHQGAQGGFHIYGSLRAQGVHPGTLGDYTDPENPIVAMTVTDSEGEWFGGYSNLPRPLQGRADGILELVSDVVILAVTRIDDAEFREVDLTVTLTDTCGTQLEDTRTLLLVRGS